MKKSMLTKFTALCLAISMAFLPVQTLKAATRPKFCNEQEWEVLRLTNEKRMAKGLDAVSTFKEIQSACDIREKELVILLSHDRPNGEPCFTVLNNIQRYSFGENIAAGQTTASMVMDSWWNSPGHKANILKENFNHMGVGYHKSSDIYRYYWVQLFIGGGCEIKRIVVNDVKNNSYKKGTSVKDMKRYLKVVCDHGITYMPLSAKMCKGYKINKKGKQTITVTYKEMETTFDVLIK